QGTGTTRSRLGHALANPVVCKGDNGRWQPNYSSLGGDLAASALMNTYYPQSNRGAGMVFGQFAINTGERELAAVVQEFVLRKLTPGAQKAK
ncbi:MAG: carboxypeptidase regulatory-like domain-containing protein, partial [Terracidiphilus sp.]